MRSLVADTPALRIHYLQEGTGSPGKLPIVLVHGFPQTSHEWRHQIPALAAAGHAVFAPDTRGFGGTGRPGVRVTRQLLVRDLIDFLDAAGVDQAHLVGHDWGGIIASAAVFERPERFATVALIDTLTTVWAPWAIHGYWFKSRGRAEDFFGRHAGEWIRSAFGGVPGSYAGPPVSPWVNPRADAASVAASARPDDPRNHWTPDDVAHFEAAFADPAAHQHAISYYRYGLPLHRIIADADAPGGERYEFLDETTVAAMWEHEGGLWAHPDANEFLTFAPEHRQRIFERPALYVGSPYLLPEAWRSGWQSHERPPTSDLFADSFLRPFPDFRLRTVTCGHFVPEEMPAHTTELLLDLAAGRLHRS